MRRPGFYYTTLLLRAASSFGKLVLNGDTEEEEDDDDDDSDAMLAPVLVLAAVLTLLLLLLLKLWVVLDAGISYCSYMTISLATNLLSACSSELFEWVARAKPYRTLKLQILLTASA